MTARRDLFQVVPDVIQSIWNPVRTDITLASLWTDQPVPEPEHPTVCWTEPSKSSLSIDPRELWVQEPKCNSHPTISKAISSPTSSDRNIPPNPSSDASRHHDDGDSSNSTSPSPLSPAMPRGSPVFSAPAPSELTSDTATQTTQMSHSPNGLGDFRCANCHQALSGGRELRRHVDEVHGTETFRCHCGKKDARKSNHERHVRPCRRQVSNAYRCRCGRETNELNEHLRHVGKWRFQHLCAEA
ncbi:hypothetical protein QBC44DRAFT_308638 [Cladorrhinum sp. PSN332]|nr:hypothetical protein QBC44DRAFT_308638 [Cladorrhinum sp. PSN332]